MKQVIQNFRNGELSVADLPAPALAPGFVLVRNCFSLISAGTERSTVSTAQASLLGKARQRPDLVKQVLESFRKDGFADTLKRVRTKLETLKELGYSSSGIVLASLDTAGAFKPGDRVACGGGGYASHAGIVAVPQNLVVHVPNEVPLDWAAFTTLGAIALQGVRQANPRLGEYVCVIGLGLLGQITAQILRANGCQVFGIDTSDAMVQLAMRTGCHAARTRADACLAAAADTFTAGHGFDSVIITAATPSSDPVDLATAIVRQKGVIVVVGAVAMNISREPHFYKKELELKISCSYGPGRYDHGYEEAGNDYPYGFVRWTENRNMAAFVRLLENKTMNVATLVTHRLEIDDAGRAYAIVTGRNPEPHVAILLSYPEQSTHSVHSRTELRTPATPLPALGVGFIGAGSFAQKLLIPFARDEGELLTVVTSRGVTAKCVADKFSFRSFSADPADVLNNPDINVVFIATRHNTHAALATAALKTGKNVFVEKPLALSRVELTGVMHAARQPGAGRLMVGFNRRFSPLARHARDCVQSSSEPMLINYRVNAGFLPKDHWIQTAEGGGRILGEVCHFIDLLQYLTGSDPVSVFAQCVAGQNSKLSDEDNAAITIRFSNGSIGQIVYVACADKLLDKERIEIFWSGQALIIDDFRSGEHYANGVCRKLREPGKGHQEEVKTFLAAVRDGTPLPLSLESIEMTTTATFAILDSLHTGLPQLITATAG